MSITLLLTATTSPGNTINVTVSSIANRRQQYLSALAFYLDSNVFQKVIFAENSGDNLEFLVPAKERAEQLGIEIELLEKCGSNDWPAYGKGRGELSIIQQAFQRSKWLQEHNDRVVKVTGRYVVRNIDRLTKRINQSGAEVICDLRGNLSTADARLFVGNKRFIEEDFFPKFESIDDQKGIYFEHVLAQAAHFSMSKGYKWELLPELPIIDGVNGTTGEKIRTSISKRIRHFLKRKIIKY
jgi:hypothetical protein